MNGNHIRQKLLTRRSALGLIGGALGGITLIGCNENSVVTTSSSSSDSAATSSSCALTPEGEIGPYFTDDSASGYNRSDIRGNIDGSSVQTGVALTLHVYVYDFNNSCAPYVGSQVDIWHCNALGVYSNEASQSTTGQSWLRGYQLTDSNGAVTFKTIIPGWYQGRTTHIHLRVRSSYSNVSSTSDGSNTTQLFFPQATMNSLYTSVAPYSSKGVDTTTNASDRVYTEQTDGKMEVVLSGDSSNGYVATIVIGLPITA